MWGAAGLVLLVVLAFVAKHQLDLRRESARVADTPARADVGVALPQAPPAPVPAAPPAPTARPGRVATSPREVCAGRADSAFHRCMKTRCAQAQWKGHAQCERLRRTDRVD